MSWAEACGDSASRPCFAAVVPFGVAMVTDSLALAGSVGLVFAFTASTICPLLLLGIWWRGLTDAGAVAGMLTGGVLCGGRNLVTGAQLAAGFTVARRPDPACGLDGSGSLPGDDSGVQGNPAPAQHHVRS